MKILHVWDQSGIGSTLGYYMDRHFGEGDPKYTPKTEVMTRAAYDPYCQTTYGQRLTCGAKAFTLKAIWRSLQNDIIHVDSFWKLLSWLPSWKPIIMHFHGSELRNTPYQKMYGVHTAKRILYSTPDLAPLLPKSAIYLHTPIDTTKFKTTNNPHRAGTVYFQHWYESPQLAEKTANQMQQPLKIIHNPISYQNMPTFLNQYEYVIDRFAIQSLSRLALEALACGCKVIDYRGEIIEGLPDAHRVENVATQLYKIYQEVLQ